MARRKVIRIDGRGLRGARGPASGPLGLGSVTADTISDSAGEQEDILAKLGGATTAQVSALADDVDGMAINLDGKADLTLGNTPNVNAVLSQDELTYPVGNELETYSQFNVFAADRRDDKREFIFNLCANFSHGPSSGGPYEYEDHKALMYFGVSMFTDCRKAWVLNPLLTIKEDCENPEFVCNTEFDFNNFSGINFGAGNAGAGLAMPSAWGTMVAGSNATGNTISGAYLILGVPGAPVFNRGFTVGPSGVVQAAFDDYSSATNSFRDTGTHSVGVELAGSYTTGAAIRIPNGASYTARTAGGATASLMALDVSGGLLFGAGGGITNALFNSAILPGGDNLYDLGANGLRWKSVWAANGTIQTSDASLKTGVAPIDPARASRFIDALEPKSYRWKIGGKNPIYGKEAQEVLVRVEKQTVVMPVPTGETREIEVEPGKFQTIAVKKETEVEVDVPVYETHDVEVVVGYEDVPGKRTHFGVLACDVKAATEAAGFEDFAGYVVGEDGIEAIRPDQLLAIALTELRTLRARVAALEDAHEP